MNHYLTFLYWFLLQTLLGVYYPWNLDLIYSALRVKKLKTGKYKPVHMSIPGNEGVMKAKLAYHPLSLIWKLLNSLLSYYHHYLLLTLKIVGRLQHREQQHEQLTHDGPAQRLDATSKPIHITSVLPIIRSVRSRVFYRYALVIHDAWWLHHVFLIPL